MNQDDRLGPYRLLRRLGEGGMGVVHLALDPRGREVAVKVLRSDVAGDDAARRRLSREVETMRRVRSPHIAEVLDADVTGPRPYIVTRYVPGRPLDEMVKQDGPLPLDALLKVAGGIAEALAAVHAAGVVHRDLKPGNVLMLDGRPVLIDFGISQAVDATRLTQTGMFIGTPGYLAPEIIEGHEAGPEVDVHAWAGTLLFAATGQAPFGKGTLEMIFYNITSGRSNVAAAPEPIQPVLRAALQRDPAKRPTAVELVDWVARIAGPATGRPRAPDEITTVPNVDDTGGGPAPRTGTSGPVVSGPVVPGQVASGQAAPGPGQDEFVSLLGDAPGVGGASAVRGATAPDGVPASGGPWGRGKAAGITDTPVFRGGPESGAAPVHPASYARPGQQARPAGLPEAQGGDPFPTVRVTGEDLRQAGVGPATPVHPRPPALSEGDIPTRRVTSDGDVPTRRVMPEGDIPTRRVTSEELRRAVAQSFPEQVRRTPESLGKAAEDFERTPHVTPSQRAPLPPGAQTPPHRQQHRQDLPGTYRQPFRPPAQPLVGGAPPHPSTAYGVAAALLFALVACAAVIAPLLAWVFTLPAVVLLRAAHIVQSRPDARNPAGASQTDLIGVLGHPDALVKSIGVTIALVPYGLILGLPVTVLLTLLVPSASVLTALSWGLAVALWTVCAGPGVEGPRHQLRRTLASIAPGDSGARGVLWGIGAAVVLVGLVALASLTGEQTAGHFWGPVDVLSLVERLSELRIHMGSR